MARETINNTFYEELAEGWYEESCHPVALLRAENAARTPWIQEKIAAHFSGSCQICDIGCGAGFLANALALEGHTVTGVDISRSSLAVARAKDTTQSVTYIEADAFKLDLPPESFDVVTSLDFLEHIEEPQKMVAMAARLIKPGGLFFYHTFNRTPLSGLLVIKGVEWFIKNTPQNMHIYRLFIKPKELARWCAQEKLKVQEVKGVRPAFDRAFWKMVFTRQVPYNLRFKMTSSPTIGFIGIACKQVL